MTRVSTPLALLVGAMLTASAATAATTLTNTGDPLPDTLINGDPYPTPPDTINGWINVGGVPDTKAIASHGWSLWAALTTPTETPVAGFTGGRIYNTWLSPQDIQAQSVAGTDGLTATRTAPDFTAPGQFARIDGPLPASVAAARSGQAAPLEAVAESVAYSPSAADHAAQYTLFSQKSLASYLETNAIGTIPAFPDDAMVVKPVFIPITGSGLTTLPAWPGTPSPARAFPSDEWGQCIYVDPTNASAGTGAVDVGCTGPTAATTYNVDDFIHLAATEKQTVTVQAAGQSPETVTLEVGDSLLLVGMHVSTREIEQWTWQTFWWTPDPTDPNLPSTDAIAAQQPDGLDAPAKNYAMAVAYSMVSPAQPPSGGNNVGVPVIAYNPHLEAPFDVSTFTIFRPINGVVELTFGVESNCMTCHAMANYAEQPVGLDYGTDFYIGRDDPAFINSVQTDFLWSIPDDAK